MMEYFDLIVKIIRFSLPNSGAEAQFIGDYLYWLRESEKSVYVLFALKLSDSWRKMKLFVENHHNIISSVNNGVKLPVL